MKKIKRIKPIIINVLPVLKADDKKFPKQVVVNKQALKRKVKLVAKDLKAHFKQKDTWPIRASEYSNDVLRPFFKVNVEDYINLLILKELGPKVHMGLFPDKAGGRFWGFGKKK